MALGSENQPLLRQQQFVQQKMLSTARGLYQQRPIAPAPAVLQRARFPAPYIKPKTSCYAAGTTLDSNNPAVVRRNARERNRVKQVNSGFSNLRQHIPVAIIADLSNGRRGIGPGANKKLSKVDTLRMAVEYIRRLQHVIEEVDGSSISGSDTASVSSYSTCSNSSSTNGSPPPAALGQHCYKSQFYAPLSYAGALQSQMQQQISPANSTASSNYSTDSCYYNNDLAVSNANSATAYQPLKYEPTYDDYSNNSTEDEELLDYISLWQDDS